MQKNLLVTLISVCTSMPLQASSIQALWQSLYQRSWDSNALLVTQTELSQYPLPLLLSSSDYPNFTQTSWDTIEALYAIRQSCIASTPISDRLKKAVEFELALCAQRVLPFQWFSDGAFLHPAGGSYVDRYLEHNQAVLSPEQQATLLMLTSGNSPRHPLADIFEQVSPPGRDALLTGSRAWLEGQTLWLSGERGWKQVPSSSWRPIAKQLNITLDQTQCDFRYSNLCIARRDSVLTISQVALALLSICLFALLLRAWYVKRQQSNIRRFVLQLLTHELRTPIASLGLTTEMLRDQFDHLNEEAQRAFWRLTEDYQRLSQLTEQSKTYLSETGDYAIQTASLEDWLAQVCSAHQVPYTLNHDQQLTLPYYWLSVCLNNLIINALHHGTRPVHVNASINQQLRITVCDQGHFPPRYQRWFKRSPNPDNMGIGLKLVRHLIQKMGGRLKIETQPTRVTMELPL
ncbi:DUF3404 domain-containing protein [Vibrio sp. JPW-9-11-11]|uniref:ATP-binding protein n=1 Tax=Vibrio sp. JPW-9-11-11 TaxID=1416532 RepID=UPI0015942B0B|nr:DUF3404 domain-containing protein [Vibrio sp. JPW-9-11-11]NVD07724.1 DUF3404 domain-containing protein [Vibrio sp. JPW-9-11-11]